MTCWGDFFGAVPAEVPGVTGIVRITGGNLGFCGLNAAGIMSCWGVLPNLPPFTPSVPVADFTVGHLHACALPVTGKAFCWGQNLAYQIGGEDPGTVDGPVEIVGQP